MQKLSAKEVLEHEEELRARHRRGGVPKDVEGKTTKLASVDPYWLQEQCGSVALALNAKNGWPIQILHDGSDISHVYTVPRAGFGADAKGIRPISEIHREYPEERHHRLETVSPDTLRSYMGEDDSRPLYDYDPEAEDVARRVGNSDKLDNVQVAQTLHANLLADPAAHLASEALREAGGKVFIVGGAIRDALLGKQPNDIDLMVSDLSPDQVDLALSRLPGRMDLTGKHFGVYRYTRKGHEVEVALPRVETSTGDTQKDFDTQIGGDVTVEQDLGRRDFTANAIAFDLQTNRIIDPHNGAKDIEDGVLKPVFPNTFKEDPTRLLRALTAHTKHGLEPDQATIDQMTDEAHRITHEPCERVQKELDKIFAGPDPHKAIELSLRTGLLKHIFPEVHDNWDFDQKNPHHSQSLGVHQNSVLRTLAEITNDPDLRLAGLLHDIGKPASQWVDDQGVAHYYRSKDGQGDDHDRLGSQMVAERLRALKYPTARIDRVKHLVNHHMFPAFSSEKGARKFLNRVGDQHADDLLTFRHADHNSKGVNATLDTSAQAMQGIVDRVRAKGQPQSIRDLAVNGQDILGLGIKPGPQVGEVLQHLTDKVIEDPEQNQKQPLLDAARTYLNG